MHAYNYEILCFIKKILMIFKEKHTNATFLFSLPLQLIRL